MVKKGEMPWALLNPLLSTKGEKRSVLDGGEGFLNASQISHYNVVTVLLMYEWTQ